MSVRVIHGSDQSSSHCQFLQLARLLSAQMHQQVLLRARLVIHGLRGNYRSRARLLRAQMPPAEQQPFQALLVQRVMAISLVLRPLAPILVDAGGAQARISPNALNCCPWPHPGSDVCHPQCPQQSTQNCPNVPDHLQIQPRAGRGVIARPLQLQTNRWQESAVIGHRHLAHPEASAQIHGDLPRRWRAIRIESLLFANCLSLSQFFVLSGPWLLVAFMDRACCM